MCNTDNVDATGGQGVVAQRLGRVDEVLERFFSLMRARAAEVSEQYEALWAALASSTLGGKRFRPRLVLSAHHGCGGSRDDAAAHVAAAFELLHTALIVHDDVIDRDFTRRGIPNVSGSYRDRAATAGIPIPAAEHRGMSTAVIAGDLALFNAYRLIDRSGVDGPLRTRLLDLMDEALFSSAAGELLDVEFSVSREIPAVEEIVHMERLKTAAYTFEAPLKAGAALADASEELMSLLGHFGRDLGIAYQATDDLLGLFGDEAQTGKSVLGDLREGKSTVPIAFAATTKLWPEIAPYVGKPDLTIEDAAAARELLIACGAEVFTRGLASRTAAEAAAHLEHMPVALSDELRPVLIATLDRTR